MKSLVFSDLFFILKIDEIAEDVKTGLVAVGIDSKPS